jgi:hypothetical protein
MMAEEIIEILKYLFDNPFFNAAIVVCAVVSVVVLVVCIAVCVAVLKEFFDIHKRHRRRK